MTRYIIFLVILFLGTDADAHGPIFSPGPETLYKDGVEVHVEYHLAEKDTETENELAIEVGYGVTENWLVSAELPYKYLKESGVNNDGLGNVALETKYRFWKRDALGKQDSMSGFAKAIFDTANDSPAPGLSSGANDYIVGLAYGQESLIWQRWASIRYRFNGDDDAGLERGDKLFADIATGWRSAPPEYYKQDVLWVLELNSEYTERSKQNGVSLANKGGTELFISPGVFWTHRAATIKGGIQIPFYSNLNGNQDQSDYRTTIAFEWRF